jgi:hypothetical protein
MTAQAAQSEGTHHSPVGVECRVRERIPCDLPSSCQPLAARAGGDFLWPATARDLSASGIGLVLTRCFEPGNVLLIEFPGAASAAPASVLARVVHATALPHGLWLVGCAFPRPLPDDEVQALVRLKRPSTAPENSEPIVARLSAEVVRDRRVPPGTTPTRDFEVRGVVFETTAPQGVAMRLLVKAFRLTGAWPLAAGTPLRVWVGKRGAGAATRVTVQGCTQGEDQWTVSYTFVEKPSAEVLRLFGLPGV